MVLKYNGNRIKASYCELLNFKEGCIVMEITIKRMLIGLTISLFLVSCGGGGSDGDYEESAYNGHWEESPECDYDATTGQGNIYKLYLSGNSLTVDSVKYPTSDCSGSATTELVLYYSLIYGQDEADVSSVCNNAREVDIVLESGILNGVNQTVQELVNDVGIAAESYDLICTSGNRLYFGDTDDQDYDGTSYDNRPILIDDSYYLVK